MKNPAHARTVVMALTATVFISLALSAQTPAPQMLRLAYLKVKPGMSPEFEALQKETAAALKKAGAPSRNVWVTASFGEAGGYVTVVPFAKFAEFDEAGALRKALGEGGYQQYLNRITRTLDEVRYKAVRVRGELSSMPQNDRPPTLALVTNVVVVPGKEAAFEAEIKNTVLPAMKKAGVKLYLVHQTMLGGSPFEYIIVSGMEKFAELDGGFPLVRGLGPEGAAALRARLTSMVQSVEYMTARLLTELSN